MLTEEQIKNLKEGAPSAYTPHLTTLIQRATSISTPHHLATYSIRITSALITSPSPPIVNRLPRRSSAGAETGQSKYVLTRLFKKGDVVTPRIYLGRKDKELEMGEKYIVTADEIAGDMVAIKHQFTLRPDIVQTCFLELITPVEELNPYIIEAHENGECGCFEVMQGKQCVSIYPYGTHETRYYKKAEQAKVAAEAECKRLNEEYRKEHE